VVVVVVVVVVVAAAVVAVVAVVDRSNSFHRTALLLHYLHRGEDQNGELQCEMNSLHAVL
jgi:hypothetical protein